jgi:hypothetical protein
VIPPRTMPPGVLQLVEMAPDKSKRVLQELPTSSKNRDRINRMRNDMLMLNPTLDLFIQENNART